MNRLLASGWFFALLLASVACRAEVLEAEGISSLDPGRTVAREAAIQDALHQAALGQGGHLESSNINQLGSSLNSIRLETPYLPKLLEVLNEWEKDGLYHVRVRAQSDTLGRNPTKLRKRIAATWFPVVDSLQAQDLDNPSKGLPEAILKRMEASGGYIVPMDIRIPALPEVVTHESIKGVASLMRSQFVLSGKIVNTSVTTGSWFLGKDERQLELELILYDGFTGARIARHVLTEAAKGKVLIGREIPFGSQSFLTTDTGRAFDRLIERAALIIDRELSCIPFSATVMKVEGDRVYIDAGNLARLSPGDSLVIYASVGPTINAPDGQILGVTEEAINSVSVIQTQPNFSIAVIDNRTNKQTVRSGDRARFQ